LILDTLVISAVKRHLARGSMPAVIRTYTGKLVDLEKPSEDVVDIDDISRALSMTCRYAGHVSRFYSVAEHSVNVEGVVNTVLMMGEEFTGSQRLAFLLHDASEAYLGDVVSPLKRALKLRCSYYEELEEEWTRVIMGKWWAARDGHTLDMVKLADRCLLGTEQVALCRGSVSDGPVIRGLEIEGWSPDEAEHRFRHRFAQLRGRP
jgi:hypothetical protein